VVLLAFVFFGGAILGLLGLTDRSLTIAGGVILFLIALRMVFPAADLEHGAGTSDEPFIVPLAIPYVAGPSALATVLLLMNREPSRWPEWLLALTLAWLVSTAILLLGGRIGVFLGRRGLVALERLMGLLLVALAVQMFLQGLRQALAAPIQG